MSSYILEKGVKIKEVVFPTTKQVYVCKVNVCDLKNATSDIRPYKFFLRLNETKGTPPTTSFREFSLGLVAISPCNRILQNMTRPLQV